MADGGAEVAPAEAAEAWPGAAAISSGGGGGGRSDARVMMRRVIPSYQVKTPLILGLVQLVFGVLILTLGIVVLSIKAFVSAGGSALLAAFGLFACGSLGIVSSKNKEVWAITLYMLLSGIAAVFTVTVMAASGVGVTREEHRPAPVHKDIREAIDLVLLVVALMATLTLVWAIILCSMTLFYGCCKQNTGVRYVIEPQVQYQRESRTAESFPSPSPGADQPSPAVLNVVGS